MKTINLTIKQIVEKYSEYLKSEKISGKEYEKMMKIFKIDMVDKYSNGEYFIINKENKVESGKMIVDKGEFREFMRDVQCHISSNLEFEISK